MNQKSRNPNMLVGSERLTASVYKTGDEFTGMDYRFNIIRLDQRTGRVNQWFRPDDLVALVKLTRVLAAELADDGCLGTDVRKQLVSLATAIDETLARTMPAAASYGASSR